MATGSLLVVAADVVQAVSDKGQLAPMLGTFDRLAEVLGKPERVLADNGYFSEANVTACAEAEITPLIALGRERHHPSFKDRFAAAPPAPENPTPLQAMAHRLASPAGRHLYAQRKQTPEPVFGIIKSVMGFPSVLAARAREGQRRVEACHHGLERQADVRPHPRLTAKT